MSRKVVLIIAAVLLVSLPVVGGIGVIALGGPGKAVVWAQRQLTLLSVRGGSEVVFEVDGDSVRRRSYELLRRSAVLHLRDAKLSFNTRLTNTGVEVSAQEGDRQAVTSVLRSKLAASAEVTPADGGVVRIGLTDALLSKWTVEAAEHAQALLTARFLDLGTKAVVTVQPQPAGARLLVQLAQSEDVQRMIALATKPGELSFRMIDDSTTPEKAQALAPLPNADILHGRAEDGRHPYLVEKRVILSGAELVDAQPIFDSRTNEPVVTFRFGTAGARKFAQATGDNVGRPMAIVVDGEVVSAPLIREPIVGGSGQISGNFTQQSASELAAVLRNGELPARLKVIGVRMANAR